MTWTRRQALQLAAATSAGVLIRPELAKPKGATMPRAFFYSPHPDDETLSMGLAMVHFIASGYDVHLVSMNSGGALGVANTLNGTAACTLPADHPYTHNPAREGYASLTVADIAAARVKEARSALGAMSMIPPTGTLGTVTHHIADLPDGFGAGTTSSSTAPVTPEGIAAAKSVIQSYVEGYPNSFHYTMSESDDHPDHAACGYALRELKNDPIIGPSLVNAKFFVSRLYWAISNGGTYPADVLAAADGTLAWFNYSGSRKAEFDAWLRTKVVVPYKAWSPAAGTYGLGYHQVAGQFNNNFGPSASIANLWHA